MHSLFILWCAILCEVAAFFLARLAFAALFGLKGRAARLGFAPEAWSPVPLVARLAFTAIGPFACYLVAAVCFALALSIGGEARTDAESLRVTAAPDGPAEASGVQDGDRIVSVDGAPVGDWDAMRRAVRAHEGGEAVPLVVDRAGARIRLRPVVGDDGRIGVTPFIVRRPVSAGRAFAEGLARPFGIVADTGRTIFHRSGPVEVVGPVGIVREVARASRVPAPTAAALAMAGLLLSYFIGVPILAAAILFPRRRGR